MTVYCPKISIITITYNSERTLEETINSVINQDYPNLEYLIIDGGSKDKTLSIIEKYKSHINYFVSEPDKGISDAFNKGIRASTGEIIGIINSDDLLLPNALTNLVEAYESDVDVYRGDIIIWDQEKDLKFTSKPSMVFKPELKNVIINHQATFVTKRTYERFGLFKVNYRYMMDQDLLIRLYQGGAKFKYIPKELAVSRCGGVTDHTNFKKGLHEYLSMIKENGGSRKLVAKMAIKVTFYRICKETFIALGLWDRLRSIKYSKK